MPGFGSGKYHVAAADSRRRLKQFLEMTGLNKNQLNYEMTIPSWETNRFSGFENFEKGDWFLYKFKIWQQALIEGNNQIFLHIDADASITRSFSIESLLLAMDDKSIGMVQQSRVLGDHPLGIKELYEHYLAVSHRAVNSGATKPELKDFKYFNTGFIFFRRKALENFLAWAEIKLEKMPREINGHMVADQDLLQVYANEIVPEEIAELDWRWNHCQWWDADFPNPRAHVIHMSNFCQGPVAGQMNRLAVLSRGTEVAEFTDLTVLIVTHNSGEVLKDLFVALLEIPGLNILVVDNNSRENPMSTENSRIRVIHNNINLGFAKAVNIGLLEVKSEYVCLLNPDALLTYEATAEAMEKLRINPSQLLAPNFFDQKGNFTVALRQGYTLNRLLEDLIPNPKSIRRRICEKLLGSIEGENFSWLIGACIFSSKEFFRQLGGLDESYFLYMEDVELGRRAKGKGLVKNLESPIEHFGAQSTDKPRIFITNELKKARFQYMKRHFGFWPWFLTKFMHKLSFVSKIRIDD